MALNKFIILNLNDIQPNKTYRRIAAASTGPQNKAQPAIFGDITMAGQQARP
jgi:hypothetical protein